MSDLPQKIEIRQFIRRRMPAHIPAHYGKGDKDFEFDSSDNTPRPDPRSRHRESDQGSLTGFARLEGVEFSSEVEELGWCGRVQTLTSPPTLRLPLPVPSVWPSGE